MPPSPSSDFTIIISLVVVCIIFLIYNLVLTVLYENAKNKLKVYRPWLFSPPLSKRKIPKNIPANSKPSNISIKWILDKVGLLATLSLKSLMKATSSSGFIRKVIASDTRNFIKRILRIRK